MLMPSHDSIWTTAILYSIWLSFVFRHLSVYELDKVRSDRSSKNSGKGYVRTRWVAICTIYCDLRYLGHCSALKV